MITIDLLLKYFKTLLLFLSVSCGVSATPGKAIKDVFINKYLKNKEIEYIESYETIDEKDFYNENFNLFDDEIKNRLKAIGYMV